MRSDNQHPGLDDIQKLIEKFHVRGLSVLNNMPELFKVLVRVSTLMSLKLAMMQCVRTCVTAGLSAA